MDGASDFVLKFGSHFRQIVRGLSVFGSRLQNLIFRVAASFKRAARHQVTALKYFSHYGASFPNG